MKLGKGNLNVHTSYDTMDKLSLARPGLDKALNYAREGVNISTKAFIELGYFI